MDEYILFLTKDEPMVDGYFSNKQLIDEGDLIYLDDLTTGFKNAQELGNTINHINNNSKYINSIIIPKEEYLTIINKKKKKEPNEVLPTLFSNHRDYYERLMGRDGLTSTFIKNLIYKDYFEYLFNHKYFINDSLVKSQKETTETITKEELKELFNNYYGNDKDITSIPYRKIRDTYVELQKYNEKDPI